MVCDNLRILRHLFSLKYKIGFLPFDLQDFKKVE